MCRSNSARECRALALWHLGTLAPWHLGTLAPWHLGTLAPWHLGTLALLRTHLVGVFRDHDEPEHLRPLGHDVADHLPGLAVRVHACERHRPCHAREDQHDREGVVPTEMREPRASPRPRRPALLRSFLEEKLREHDENQRAGPIGDGVAVEGADVRLRIGRSVERDPERQYP